MASVGALENIDTTYANDGTDDSVRVHQQEHDKDAKVVNRFDYDAMITAGDGQLMAYYASSGLWGPITGHSALIPKVVYEETPGGNYTFVVADAGKLKGSLTSDTTPLTYTYPLNATAAIPVGSVMKVLQRGTGQITIVGETGVTLQAVGGAYKTSAQFASLTLTKLYTNTVLVEGGIN